MPVELIGKIQQKNNGAFKLVDVADLDAGTLDIVMQLIAGGGVVAGADATTPVGEIAVQRKTTTGTPTHVATEATLCWNEVDEILYASQGAGTWVAVGGGTHPNLAVHDALGLATDAEAQALVDVHTSDLTAAHIADAVGFTPAGNLTESDLQAVLEQIDAITAKYVFPEQYGAIADGVADDSTALNAAADAALADDKVLAYAPGANYYITSTHLIRSDTVDFGATITWDQTSGVAVMVGNGTTAYTNIRVSVPDVVQAASVLWGGSDIGIELAGVHSSRINIGKVSNFAFGVHATAGSQPFTYNGVTARGLMNNRVNLVIDQGTSTSYCNENVWDMGRYFHNSQSTTITNAVYGSGQGVYTTSGAHRYIVGETVTLANIQTTGSWGGTKTIIDASYDDVDSIVFTLSAAHTYVVGQSVAVTSVDPTVFNTGYIITAVTSTSVTVAAADPGASYKSGGSMKGLGPFNAAKTVTAVTSNTFTTDALDPGETYVSGGTGTGSNVPFTHHIALLNRRWLIKLGNPTAGTFTLSTGEGKTVVVGAVPGGGSVVFTTANFHPYMVGDPVVITGLSAYNATYTVTAVGTRSFTVTSADAGTLSSVHGFALFAPTTSAIAYNASTADVQTALEALPNIGAGGVVVTGLTGGPFTANLTVQAALRGGPLSGSGTGLTSGTFSVTVGNSVNHHRFLPASIEGTIIERYKNIVCDGSYNKFDSLRYESTGAAGISFRGSTATRNEVLFGYAAQNLVVISTGSSNHVYTTAQVITGASSAVGVHLSRNSSSSALPIWLGFESAVDLFRADLATNVLWSVAIGAQHLRGKRSTDTVDRVHLNYVTAAVDLGPGTSAADVTLDRKSANIARITASSGLVTTGPIAPQDTAAKIYSGSGSPEGAVTGAIGSEYLRTDGGAGTAAYIKESGAGNTGWVALESPASNYIAKTAVIIQAGPFSKSGVLATGAGTFRWYNDTGQTLTIRKVRASGGTAPVGAAILVDVNIDATTIWSSQANRVTIADGANTGTQTTFNTTTVADGHYFTVDIDQVGSSTAGSDLVVDIWLSLA